jgi:sugar phosphate isomerase/epimerase
MHHRISVHSICFPGASVGELARRWRSLEADRVSLSSDLLLPDDGAAARMALRAGGHRLETITHPFASGRHLHRDPQFLHDVRERLDRVTDIAARLGAQSIYMLTGGHGSLDWEQAAEIFSEAVAPCIARARRAGVALLIENAPPLYADLHIAHSLRDTVALAEMAGIGVCIDIFSCWTEAGLRQSIDRAMPRCGLVQVSDYVYGDRSLPSRAVPGDGVIPLQRILGWIVNAGYQGVFDLELLGPRIKGEEPEVRRAAENLHTMLRSLGIADR